MVSVATVPVSVGEQPRLQLDCAAAREQQTPEALVLLQKTEIDRWWPIIKAANIKAERFELQR
jgi:hypothetical protein